MADFQEGFEDLGLPPGSITEAIGVRLLAGARWSSSKARCTLLGAMMGAGGTGARGGALLTGAGSAFSGGACLPICEIAWSGPLNLIQFADTSRASSMNWLAVRHRGFSRFRSGFVLDC